MQLVTLLLIILSAFIPNDLPSKRYIVEKVNHVRSKGCHCGRTYYPPAPPVRWNNKLYDSAYNHASQMRKYDFFSHESIYGENLGERISQVDYNWKYVGENLGVGQRTFDEVLQDWIESRSHCEMLMNPKVNEMAVAKSGKYWVQHFGKKQK